MYVDTLGNRWNTAQEALDEFIRELPDLSDEEQESVFQFTHWQASPEVNLKAIRRGIDYAMLRNRFEGDNYPVPFRARDTWISDQAIRALIDCLVWQAVVLDEDGGGDMAPADELGYSVDDLERDSRQAVIEDYRAYVAINTEDIEWWNEHTGHTDIDNAHDYILTRNGHGAGFWDRCYCGECERVKNRLSDRARDEGELDLAISDSGSLVIG